MKFKSYLTVNLILLFAATAYAAVHYKDNQPVYLGDDDDSSIYFDTTDMIITSAGDLVVEADVTIGDTTNDAVLTFDAPTDGLITLEAATGRFNFSRPVYLTDSLVLSVGSSQDLQIYHNGANSFIRNFTGDFSLDCVNEDLYLKTTKAGKSIFASIGGSTKLIISENSAKTNVGRIHNTTRKVAGDSPYTVLASDHILYMQTDAGAITANLPAGVEGTHYKLINCGSSGNDLTVDGNAAETVYSALTAVLSDGEVIDIHYNATEGWW